MTSLLRSSGFQFRTSLPLQPSTIDHVSAGLSFVVVCWVLVFISLSCIRTSWCVERENFSFDDHKPCPVPIWKEAYVELNTSGVPCLHIPVACLGKTIQVSTPRVSSVVFYALVLAGPCACRGPAICRLSRWRERPPRACDLAGPYQLPLCALKISRTCACDSWMRSNWRLTATSDGGYLSFPSSIKSSCHHFPFQNNSSWTA